MKTSDFAWALMGVSFAVGGLLMMLSSSHESRATIKARGYFKEQPAIEEPIVRAGSPSGVPSSSLPQREPAQETGTSKLPGGWHLSSANSRHPELEGLDESWLPTAFGLWSYTTDQWQNEDFLALTEEEVRDMLPATSQPMSMPAHLLDLVGSLPSIGECESSMGLGRVQELLIATCAQEALVATMQAAPSARRTQEFVEGLYRARQLRDASARALMAELDRVSSWRNWELCWKLWGEFER